ncbi:MAG: HDIG domain-containing protein [Thaumarchaeota archaeon]|nr:HDIG domain-containing protein [Nitrososphaerota archaeon]
MIPDERAALQLHKKHRSNEHIVRHCETVAKVAKILVGRLEEKGVPINGKTVLAGALLHDIGRTKTQTVHHGHAGGKIVASEGVDAEVVSIIQRHVGAGISKEEADSLGFPQGDYIPRTLEEKVVCFSDKMVDLDRVRPFSEEVNRFRRKGHDLQRLEELKKSLEKVLGEDPESLIFSNLNTGRQ